MEGRVSRGSGQSASSWLLVLYSSLHNSTRLGFPCFCCTHNARVKYTQRKQKSSRSQKSGRCSSSIADCRPFACLIDNSVPGFKMCMNPLVFTTSGDLLFVSRNDVPTTWSIRASRHVLRILRDDQRKACGPKLHLLTLQL